jgi:hypothetical protein
MNTARYTQQPGTLFEHVDIGHDGNACIERPLQRSQ